MRTPNSVRGLENLGRVKLSENFYFRDFLYSEIANYYGLYNVPEYPDIAIATGKKLCEETLEPLHKTFGKVCVRSGYRSSKVTAHGNSVGIGASPKNNNAYHIWDHPNSRGEFGAAACIVIPWFTTKYENGRNWRDLAWWIFDNINFNHLQFFPNLCAFNIQLIENQEKRIESFIAPKGVLFCNKTKNVIKPDRCSFDGFPKLIGVSSNYSN